MSLERDTAVLAELNNLRELADIVWRENHTCSTLTLCDCIDRIIRMVNPPLPEGYWERNKGNR